MIKHYYTFTILVKDRLTLAHFGISIRKNLIQLILLIIVFCRISFSQDILGPTPLKDNPPINLVNHITLGEELSYIASWAGFPAGSIRTKVWRNFKEIDSKKVFLFEATLETNDFVSFFYPVKNTIHSFTEAEKQDIAESS